MVIDSDASTAAVDTDAEWQRILECCERQASIGFGLLDSFLSGPDVDRRVALVAAAAASNEWLRLELRDTLTLDHSTDFSAQQLVRLLQAASDPSVAEH